MRAKPYAGMKTSRRRPARCRRKANDRPSSSSVGCVLRPPVVYAKYVRRALLSAGPQVVCWAGGGGGWGGEQVGVVGGGGGCAGGRCYGPSRLPAGDEPIRPLNSVCQLEVKKRQATEEACKENIRDQTRPPVMSSSINARW